MLFARRDLLSRYLALALTLFLLVQAAPIISAYSSAPQQAPSIEDLWMDMRIGPPLIPLFNQAARSDDIARVDHPSQVGQLSGIETGRKLVIFKSVAETEQLLPDMAGEIDIVGYNLEHGPATPAEEQADPVGSIKTMRELADQYELELALGPDHDFALSHGVEMAPFVDIFVMQIQRQQTNPQIVEEFVVPLVPKLREANPDLEISVQVRTEGDVQGIVELLDSLKADLDGVSILTSPDTVDVAEELVVSLRPYVTLTSKGIDQYAIYILLAVGALIVIAGIFIIRRRQLENSEVI